VAGVELDDDADARPQRRHILVAGIDVHAHRHALHDLDPVSTGVLRRQQGKLLRRRRADALDHAVPHDARIGIDGYRCFLAGTYMRELGFLRSRVDPEVIGVDEIDTFIVVSVDAQLMCQRAEAVLAL